MNIKYFLADVIAIYFININSCIPKGLCVPQWVGWVRLIVIHPILIAWAWWVRK